MEMNVQRGVMMPSKEAIIEFVNQLQAEMKQDEELKVSFGKYPREVLANRGINKDLQVELLAELQGVTAASCYVTCGCSGCCVSNG